MLIEILHIAATVLIGLYAGSLLTEAFILVPYWRKMPADQFLKLHGTMGPSLFRYFAPLTTVAVISSVLAAIWGDIWDKGAAALCVMALIIFFAFFKRANAQFADQSLSKDELPGALKRWTAWHNVRTVLVLIAFVLSVISHQYM